MPHLIPPPVLALASPPHTRDQRQPAFQTPQTWRWSPGSPLHSAGTGLGPLSSLGKQLPGSSEQHKVTSAAGRRKPFLDSQEAQGQPLRCGV